MGRLWVSRRNERHCRESASKAHDDMHLLALVSHIFRDAKMRTSFEELMENLAYCGSEMSVTWDQLYVLQAIQRPSGISDLKDYHRRGITFDSYKVVNVRLALLYRNFDALKFLIDTDQVNRDLSQQVAECCSPDSYDALSKHECFKYIDPSKVYEWAKRETGGITVTKPCNIELARHIDALSNECETHSTLDAEDH